MVFKTTSGDDENPSEVIEFLVDSNNICFCYRRVRESIPAIFRMLTIGLDRKAPIERRIMPALCIVSNFFKRYWLAE